VNLCIYCQKNPATTRDHVTLRGLYREPRPSNLITVPACGPCNSAFGSDDEYFLRLALDWGASESGDGRAAADNRMRSMQRKQGRGFWRPFFATLKPVEVHSPGGIFLVNSLEFRLDTSRLQRTINRMIRGLYYHETKSCLPVGDYVRSLPYPHFIEQYNNNSEAKAEMVVALGSLPAQFIGDAFAFRYAIMDPARQVSLWNLMFYRRIEFVGTTGDQKDPEIWGSQSLPEERL
jgi:hypothetical protein